MKLKRARVKSVAICFLHAYRNAANERAVGAALSGDWYLCTSHEISPEFREYERGSTTFINAYVGPLMENYLTELSRARRYRIAIMQSNGGFLSAQRGAPNMRFGRCSRARRAGWWVRSKRLGTAGTGGFWDSTWAGLLPT